MGRTFESLSSEILGAAVEVHRTLGPGFLEHTYNRAMRIALERKGIPYRAEWEIPLHFAGANVGSYRLDLIADEKILLELKAVRRFEDLHFAQVRAYLKASGLQIGLLLNFNARVIAVRRVVHDLPD